jgi:hypothetical protein
MVAPGLHAEAGTIALGCIARTFELGLLGMWRDTLVVSAGAGSCHAGAAGLALLYLPSGAGADRGTRANSRLLK